MSADITSKINNPKWKIFNLLKLLKIILSVPTTEQNPTKFICKIKISLIFLIVWKIYHRKLSKYLSRKKSYSIPIWNALGSKTKILEKLSIFPKETVAAASRRGKVKKRKIVLLMLTNIKNREAPWRKVKCFSAWNRKISLPSPSSQNQKNITTTFPQKYLFPSFHSRLWK